MLPPRATLATWLLRLFVSRRDAEFIVGDLEEEYASCSGSGARCSWYWGQVTRSVPPLLWEPVRQSGYVSTIAVGILACAAQAAIELTIGFAAYYLSLFGTQSLAAPTAVVTVVSIAGVGYGAAWLRRGAGIAFAVVAACVVAIELLLGAIGHRISLGTFAALFLGPLTALAGGLFGEHARHRA